MERFKGGRLDLPIEVLTFDLKGDENADAKCRHLHSALFVIYFMELEANSDLFP